jgi:3-dehydroquinate synthase
MKNNWPWLGSGQILNYKKRTRATQMSHPQQIVQVELAERAYEITIGTECLDQIGPMAESLGGLSSAIVITDKNVHHLHAEAVAQSLAKEDFTSVDLMVVEAGETSKSIEVAAGLWESLYDARADRKTLIVAVGGGVVGDLAGFVAATYMRGVRLIQVPTSLLAQVDSSVGGKTGINLPTGKNLVGAFLQPSAVLIDTTTLTTLPEREYLAGLGEVVKYGVILDGPFFEQLEKSVPQLLNRDQATLASVVKRNCQLKAQVVVEDERETLGRRALLNYGHTIGHAVESLSGYGTYLHGEAVSIGMVAASRLAEQLGRINAEVTQRQIDLLEKLGLPIELPDLDPNSIIESMQHDKKADRNQIRFVLPNKIGQAELVDSVDPEELLIVLGK